MKYPIITLAITLFISQASFSQKKEVLSPDLESVTIDSIHSAIQNHQLTCLQLFTVYLDRIKKYNLSINRRAPINAWSEINPSVLTQAQQLDADLKKTGQISGSLHCIPVI